MFLAAQHSLRFGSPWWLTAAVLIVPAVWLGVRNLASLGRGRQVVAIVLRSLVIGLLAVLLAQPKIQRKHEQLSLVVVFDRSQSVPQGLDRPIIDRLEKSASSRRPGDLFGVVDVAESTAVAVQPGPDSHVPARCTSLAGSQSRLSAGIQMAMAIISPESAARLLLVSDGNQTAGDLHEAARIAAANHVPIDVLPIRYQHRREVAMERLVVPGRARSKQTVAVRFVVNSTAAASGRLMLSLNGAVLPLGGAGADNTLPIALVPGLNVRTVSVPLGESGLHEFTATFIPDDPGQDGLSQNNMASAATFVAGPGVVLLIEPGDKSASAEPLSNVLSRAGIVVHRSMAAEFPERIAQLLDVESVVMVNIDSSRLSRVQQEMVVRYIRDLGGGLAMVGGPDSFGAGGWIDSPLADVLPVNLDPPQKKTMQSGALVLVIDRSGSMSGEKLEMAKAAAIGAMRTLSRLDRVGVIMFDDAFEWAVPIQQCDDKVAIENAIRKVPEGGGTDLAPAMAEAFKALSGGKGIRHAILLTDGQTSGPPCIALAGQMKNAKITASTVAVGPDADWQLLGQIATITGGRWYRAQNPKQLPQIFIKEAQIVRRSLIQEDKKGFRLRQASPLSEIVAPGEGLPPLNGYVLTGAKGGTAQTVLTSQDGDPILATGPAGLGRVVAFTSSADSRWAKSWVQGWGGYARFWEQAIRWASRSNSSADCDIFTEVHGRNVLVTVESAESDGRIVPITSLAGQVIDPGMKLLPLALEQVGPGQFRGQFNADAGGSYLINVSYGRSDSGGRGLAQAVAIVPFAPEFADTSDNRALLAEIAGMTGGRVLDASSPGELFDRTGITFPQASQPITAPLMLAWLSLFLLDVAVRRIAMGPARAVRWVVFLPVRLVRRRKLSADSTLARLNVRRQQVRKTLTHTPSPVVSLTESAPPPPAEAGTSPARGEGLAQPPAADTTMDRLLRMKRQKRK